MLMDSLLNCVNCRKFVNILVNQSLKKKKKKKKHFQQFVVRLFTVFGTAVILLQI